MVTGMSTFASVESMWNTQHHLTDRVFRFITVLTPDGASLRPLPTARHSEHDRREVPHV